MAAHGFEPAPAVNAGADGVQFLRRGANGYETARQNAVWNGRKPDRYPDAIALARSESDVVAAVGRARSEGWKIGIRSGGHSWAGYGVRDGGLLLDLSLLNDVQIDRESMTASVAPAIRGRVLQFLVNQQGYYVPTAGCSTVGIGGFLVGGGAAIFSYKDGPGCASVQGINVVTADGQLRFVDDSSPQSDLLWAARGAGPGYFAAITRFKLKLRPLPKSMQSTIYIYPAAVVRDFLPWYEETCTKTAGTVATFWMAIESWLPDYRGKIIAQISIASGDSDSQTAAYLEPFGKGPLAAKAIFHQGPAPWTFQDGYDMVDRLYQSGHRYRSDCLWMKNDDPGARKPIEDIVLSIPSRYSHVLGAPWVEHRVPNAAYSLASALSLHVYGVGETPQEDTGMSDWVNRSLHSLEPHSLRGGKANDSDLSAYHKRILSAPSAARVEQLRRKYDPKGVFQTYLGAPVPEKGA